MGEVKQTNFRIDQDSAAAEARIREQFAADLTRKDKTIDELREKVEQLQAELDTERAVIAKEREMQAQLREADKENARLSALLEQVRKA